MDNQNESDVQDEQKKKSYYATLEAQLRRSRVSIDLAIEDTSLPLA